MGRRLVILGAGGGANDVLDIVVAGDSGWEVVGFLDDGRPSGSEWLGHPVLGKLADAGEFADCWFINTIRSERNCRAMPEIVAKTGIGVERFATLVHPGASVSRLARLGRGVYVSFGSSVGGKVVLSDHTALCPGCIVGHDTIIEDHATLAPGAVVSGGVRIGACTYIGARTVIRQGLSIGRGALVGMGAVVVRDVADGVVVVGNPARMLERPSGTQKRVVKTA